MKKSEMFEAAANELVAERPKAHYVCTALAVVMGAEGEDIYNRTSRSQYTNGLTEIVEQDVLSYMLNDPRVVKFHGWYKLVDNPEIDGYYIYPESSGFGCLGERIPDMDRAMYCLMMAEYCRTDLED